LQHVSKPAERTPPVCNTLASQLSGLLGICDNGASQRRGLLGICDNGASQRSRLLAFATMAQVSDAPMAQLAMSAYGAISNEQ
jgi:hypothetical protein